MSIRELSIRGSAYKPLQDINTGAFLYRLGSFEEAAVQGCFGQTGLNTSVRLLLYI